MEPRKKVKDWTIEDIERDMERIERQKALMERFMGKSVK